jgi:hypothetical protein
MRYVPATLRNAGQGAGPLGGPRHQQAIKQRAMRLTLLQECQKYWEECINEHVLIWRDKSNPNSERMKAMRTVLEYGFGKPGIHVEVEQQAAEKLIIEARWLPPDPNDHSKVIEPEPD